MDAKDLRTESSMSERSNDGNAKYAQGSAVLQCNRKNPYQDIGSNSLGKVEVQTARPCAVIGPDRIVPPPVSTDAYLKKNVEPWAGENIYRQPPEYPHKISDYHLPTRNISPRQTFQENMQRIMVPPSYNTTKLKEDHNFPVDANVSSLRNSKTNVPAEAKYCDVPYTINPNISDQKTVRNPDVNVFNINATLPRNAPHMWPPGSATPIRPPKPYGAPEMYPYMEYPSCGGPRPMVVPRSQRTIHEEPPPVYSDPFYHESSLRFKPYPAVKERYPHARYDYIGNYPAPFHPPHLPPKYDLQKTIPSHPYTGYPQVPFKYLDSRIPEQFMNGYQRPLNQQHNFNAVPFRNQVMHPGYGPVVSNGLQTNKYFPYPTDSSIKPMTTNKLPYDAAHKMYAEYENSRPKPYGIPENYYVNEMGRQVMKGQVLPPNYPSVNIHPLPPHPYYRKDNAQLKQFEYNQQFRNIDQSININGATLSRLQSQFSPGNIAISPSDSNTSNETSHTQGTLPEDCGYVSQSSTASIRSMESGINRIPSDPYKRFDYRYGPLSRTSPLSSKLESNSKTKKGIDVRQYLQMWNEGEEDNSENTTKEVSLKAANEMATTFENSNQEQLYVLGLVNVPSEELSKYEHIQKVSKLPENIKGYNSIELLNQFEEAIESSNLNHCNYKPHRDYVPLKGQSSMHTLGIPSRPLSPLDVEAKISQSVIHKEVGCNFEIKPCSPKMLNVDVPTPVQLLNERSIERVSNHHMISSPQIQNVNDNAINCNVNHPEHRITVTKDHSKVPSCKMVNTKYDSIESDKTDYSLQDLESNSGVCLASLPRLDNDIELNFPEVNQQFINANKVESVITTTQKDLPTLDLDQPTLDQEIKENKVDQNLDGEKSLTKLSKYRKQKRKESEPTESRSEMNVQSLRTDSVIIKNPENKSYEDNFKDFTNSDLSPKQDPINLAVKTGNIKTDSEIEFRDNNCYEDDSNDLAINFSLNSKTDSVVSNLADPGKTDLSSPRNNESQNLDEGTNIKEKINSDIITDNDIFSFNNSDSDFISCSNACISTVSEANMCKEINLFQRLNDSDNSITNEVDKSIMLSTENKHDVSNTTENQDNQIFVEISEMNIVTVDPKIELEKSTLRQEPHVEDSKNMIQDIDKYNTDYNKISLKNSCHISKELFSPYIQNLALFSEGLCSDSAQALDLKLERDKTDESLIVHDANNRNEIEEIIITDIDNKKPIIVPEINIVEKDTSIEVDESPIVYDLSPKNETQEKSNIDLENKIPMIPYYSEIDEKDIDSNESLSVLDTSHKKSSQGTISQEKTIEDGMTVHKTELDEKNTTDKTDDSLTILCKNDKHESRERSNKENNDENEVILKQTDIVEKVNNNKTDGSLSVLDINCKYRPETRKNNEIENAVIVNGSESKGIDTKSYNNKDFYAGDICEPKSTKVLVDYSDCEDDTSEDDISGDEKCTQAFCNRDIGVDNKENVEKVSLNINCNLSDSFEKDSNNIIEHVQAFSDSATSSYSENTKPEGLFATSETLNIMGQNDNASPVTVSYTKQVIKNSTDFSEESSSFEHNIEIQNIEIENLPLSKKYPRELGKKNTILEENTEIENVESFALNKEDSRELGKESPSLEENTEIENVKCSELNKEDSTEFSKNLSSEESEEIQNMEIVINKEELTDFSNESPYLQEKTQIKNIENFTLSKKYSMEFSKESQFLVENKETEDIENFPVNHKLSEINNFNNTFKIKSEGSDSKKSNFNTTSLSTQKPSEVSCNEKSCDESSRDSMKEIQQNFIDNVHLNSISTNNSEREEISQKHELAQIDNTIINQIETRNYLLQMEICNEAVFPVENLENVNRKRCSLKRSLSDSALNLHSPCSRPDCDPNCTTDESLWPAKRKRLHIQNFDEPVLIANRRNSISSFYNEENVSICILIDNNCIITEDESSQEESYTEITEDCLPCFEPDVIQDYRNIESEDEVLGSASFETDIINKSYMLNSAEEEKSFEEVWVQDVACVETVVTDDVAEDVELSASPSPKSIDMSGDESNNNEANLFDVNNHSDKVKYIYGGEMCSSDAQLVETLYRTPQMDVTALMNRESNFIDDGTKCYDNESLEDILSDYKNDNHKTKLDSSKICSTSYSNTPLFNSHLNNLTVVENFMTSHSASLKSGNSRLLTQDDTVHSCESSSDNVFNYEGQPEENTNYTVSSSPEVSSTTSEDKNSSILLKITNYGGSRTSQINETHSNKKHNTVSCKYTETKDYISTDNNLPVRPLITKAAQKYIPPLKETIRDLKVKLHLPPQSLMKLKQLKLAKEQPKPNVSKNNIMKNDIPKKSKPKFEDVLKSIDEIQFKNYKEKSKKVKKIIPKVVIKKNENGSHYASTSNVDKYNPDLTGMKWQPWVFLDKNSFIDKMALRKKTRAIFNHRKNTYVLAETFKKYKSISSNSRFVISQPEINNTGKLKYTIRLKHSNY